MILFADDAIKIGGQLFLFANKINLLFTIDISDGEISFLGGIPGKKPLSERLTCKLIYWEKQIIIVPLLAEEIWFYSLEDKSWKNIVIQDYRSNIHGSYLRQAIIYQGSLFLVGGHYRAIIKMDLSSYEISYIREPFAKYGDDDAKELYFRGDFVFREDALYLASARDNSILVFDLKKQAYKWVEIGKKENRYSGIIWDGSHYWLSPRENTSVVKWDGKDGVVDYEIPMEKRVNHIAYAGIVDKGNCVTVPALYGSQADSIFVSKKDGAMKFDQRQYSFYKKTEEGDYIAQDSEGKIIFITLKGKEKQFKCEISDKQLCMLWNMIRTGVGDLTNRINKESEPLSLGDFLRLEMETDALPVCHGYATGLSIYKTAKIR